MFVSYKKISNRREDCFPNGSGNMLIKSNWTRNEEAKRGKIHRCQRSLWSKKDRAYHTWTRRGRRLGIVALTHMTMYRVSRHAAFPCFAPFAPFQNDVRVSFMCHSCGATSFSNSIPRYLQSRIYIYIYRWPMFSRQQGTIPHLPFPYHPTKRAFVFTVLFLIYDFSATRVAKTFRSLFGTFCPLVW